MKQSFYKAFIAISLIFGVSNLYAQEITDQEITNQEIYLKALQKKATEGDVASQIFFGSLNQFGIGIDQDYEKAIFWYEKAAEQESIPYHVIALIYLGYMYEKGIGTEQNYKKAFDLYKKASDRGFIDAQTDLGVLYLKGFGVDINYKKALYLLEKSVEEYSPDAYYYLAEIYKDGLGINKNYKKAFNLYKESEESFSNNMKQLDHYYDALREIFNLKKEDGSNDIFGSFIVNLNNVLSDINISENINNSFLNSFSNRFVLEKLAKVIDLYKQNKLEILAKSQYNLGFMYYEGLGVRQNLNQAKEYFGLSCDGGIQDGCNFYKKLNELGIK